MSKVKIVDEYGGTAARKGVTVERGDVASTIRPWFPDAPQDVVDAIEKLQDRINRGEDHYAIAGYLGLRIREAS